MKGLNKIIFNEDQMIFILNEWWNNIQYKNSDICTSVIQEGHLFIASFEGVKEINNEGVKEINNHE
jgi:hypothetical protein